MMSFKFFVHLTSPLSNLKRFLCYSKYAFQLQNFIAKVLKLLFQVKRIPEKHSIRFLDLINDLKPFLNEFEGSFNELNKTELPSTEKIQMHLKVIEMQYEFLVTFIKTISFTLSSEDRNEANIILITQKTKLDIITGRLKIQNASSFTKAQKTPDTTENLSQNETNFKSMPLNEKTCNIQPCDENVHETKPFDFLNAAAEILSDFNGEFKYLSKFLDSIDLINLIKGPYEDLAVSLVKSKITGEIHHFITNASTLMSIKKILIEKVQGPSISTITRKLQNAKQYSKNSFTYATYIRKLAYLLKQKYIFDGLSPEIAEKYSLQIALSAIIKNAKSADIKAVMLASQFSAIEDVITKFLEVSVELKNEESMFKLKNRLKRKIH